MLVFPNVCFIYLFSVSKNDTIFKDPHASKGPRNNRIKITRTDCNIIHILTHSALTFYEVTK